MINNQFFKVLVLELNMILRRYHTCRLTMFGGWEKCMVNSTEQQNVMVILVTIHAFTLMHHHLVRNQGLH